MRLQERCRHWWVNSVEPRWVTATFGHGHLPERKTCQRRSKERERERKKRERGKEKESEGESFV